MKTTNATEIFNLFSQKIKRNSPHPHEKRTQKSSKASISKKQKKNANILAPRIEQKRSWIFVTFQENFRFLQILEIVNTNWSHSSRNFGSCVHRDRKHWELIRLDENVSHFSLRIVEKCREHLI